MNPEPFGNIPTEEETLIEKGIDFEIHKIREISREQAKREIWDFVRRGKETGMILIPTSEIVEYLKLDIELVDSILKEGQPENQSNLKDYTLKDSGQRKIFETGANRDLSSGKGRFDLLPPATLRMLSVHFEKGAEKYSARNWEKGIPVSRYIDSALRHTFQFADGCDDENHLIAAIWNLICMYETIIRTQKDVLPKDLYDLPRKVNLPAPYEQKV